MNTTSSVLNGRTGSTISIMPPSPKRRPQERPTFARSHTTPIKPPSRPVKSRPSTPVRSASSSPRLHPKHSRTPSRDSTGWYLDEDTPTLEDFADRAKTVLKRIERFQTRCATNVVMALMRPGLIALVVLNPVALMLWVVIAIAWFSLR